jgi:serine phosphatase RsbU (regulator of sigma subunit)
VTWGGNPHETEIAGSGRLSPRRSFAAWTEVVRGTARPWLPHEVAAARALGEQVAAAGRARAEQESRMAAALQRTLLLDELPAVPGVDLAARYLPSADDVVGGDWYDLVPLPSGRLSLVLGDVAGHGLSAAAVTAQVRHALRATLLRDLGPGAALAELNRLLTALLPGEMATVVIAELDPAGGEVAVARAGHLPVLSTATGFVGAGRGPALGILDDAEYPETRLWLAGEERLLLFSDGLVERRGQAVDVGLAALEAAAAVGAADVSALLDAVVAVLDPPGTDDVTLLGLGRGS